ncbi:MAG: hypothetical protein IJQ94_01185 [Bacteroidales bacterium]|nr:hypothetical protein [Bacteroidales bacterium]
MKKSGLILIALLATILLAGCKDYAVNKLKRQMKPFAKSYLKTEKVVDYDSLTIDCVDTLTEMSYANLNIQLLGEMEAAYQAQYEQAAQEGKGQTLEYISLYLNEINNTRVDFEDLLESGSLKSEGILLFMVSGHYVKDKERVPFIFLVTPDKRKLHTLDPFGDNLLYQDEQ